MTKTRGRLGVIIKTWDGDWKRVTKARENGSVYQGRVEGNVYPWSVGERGGNVRLL